MKHVHPMHPAWLATFGGLGLLGALAFLACLADLTGISGDDVWTGAGSAAELWLGLAFGLWMGLFSVTALRHGRLTVDERGVSFLSFGLLCSTETVPWSEVRRFGDRVVTEGPGRRGRLLLLELAGGGRRIVKISLYRRARDVIRRVSAHLGREPTPTRWSPGGVTFEKER